MDGAVEQASSISWGSRHLASALYWDKEKASEPTGVSLYCFGFTSQCHLKMAGFCLLSPGCFRAPDARSPGSLQAWKDSGVRTGRRCTAHLSEILSSNLGSAFLWLPDWPPLSLCCPLSSEA